MGRKKVKTKTITDHENWHNTRDNPDPITLQERDPGRAFTGASSQRKKKADWWNFSLKSEAEFLGRKICLMEDDEKE